LNEHIYFKAKLYLYFILGLSTSVFQSAAVPAAAGFRTTLRCVPARSSPPSASGSRSAKKCY